MRAAILLFVAVLTSPAQPAREFVHAVEFPYYAYPHSLWERELVWLHNIGIRTVAFSVPASWHEPRPGVFDYTGTTSPRRDLAGLLRLMKALEMRAWVRGRVPPQARDVLARGLLAGEPSGKVEEIGMLAPDALVRSRRALAQGVGAIIWREVEDRTVPAGWEALLGATFRPGAVSMSGDESPAAAALRRNSILLQNWAAVLPEMRATPVRPAKGKLPKGVTATQLLSRHVNGPSAVSVTNDGDGAFEGELRVYLPSLHRNIGLPKVTVPARGALWLPVRVPLSDPRLCRNCSVFANTDYIAYATAELHFLEYENGILAMEFAAPTAGELVLQLSRQPSGPFLAGGRPAEFDWDGANMRARLTIPAGRGLGSRVRISLAIDPPESSGFLKDLGRLLIGPPNQVTASYSSEELAARSRLRVPAGFSVKELSRQGEDITYQVTTPSDAVHGEFTDLALEADGVTLGRAHVPLVKPATLRLPQAIQLHAGTAQLPVDPPIIVVEPRGSRNLDITVRNHSSEIRTFAVNVQGAGVEFSPAKTEVTIGPVMERVVSLRVFTTAPGLYDARIRMSGGAEADMPIRLLSASRNQAIAWQADLDGDGIPEHVLENQRARAVFSTAGGRWLEFLWKDTNADVLPPQGAFGGPDRLPIEAVEGGIRIGAGTGAQTVRLHPSEARLTIEHAGSLPDVPSSAPQGLRFQSTAETPMKTVFRIEPAN